jgi:hypothetical protein
MPAASLAAQRALVRMLFDPAFAAAARERPDEALADVPPPLRGQLQGIDERALRRDRLRRRRALGVLFEEWKASTTLALLETRSYEWLEGFFSSAHFHRAVAERGSMALGYAAFLADAVAERRLQTPLIGDVLLLETATARARRAVAEAERCPAGPRVAPNVRDEAVLALAPGVAPLEVALPALEALQTVERYLFESALLAPIALCTDLPGPQLPTPTLDRLQLITVPTGAGITLVTVERDLFGVILGLGCARPVADVLAEAAMRGVDRTSGRSILVELIEDEIVIGARLP